MKKNDENIIKKALEFFNEAKKLYNSCTSIGWSIKVTFYNPFQKAVKLLEDLGTPEAFYQLGKAYEEESHEQDYEIAAKYYNKALEKGHIEAKFRRARLYERESGEENQEAALELYEQGMLSKHIPSIYHLACMQAEGRGTEVDKKTAITYLNKIEEYPLALYKLGELHENLKEYDLAIEYYLKAININIPQAIDQLGLLYEKLKKYDLNLIVIRKNYIQELIENKQDELILKQYEEILKTFEHRITKLDKKTTDEILETLCFSETALQEQEIVNWFVDSLQKMPKNIKYTILGYEKKSPFQQKVEELLIKFEKNKILVKFKDHGIEMKDLKLE